MSNMNLDEQSEEVRGRGKRESGGARIALRDSRMSAVVSIGLAITPIAVVAIGAWIANSIGTLNGTVTKLVVQNEAIIERLNAGDRRDDRQDTHMEATDFRVSQTERDIASMGGPNYRGRRGN